MDALTVGHRPDILAFLLDEGSQVALRDEQPEFPGFGFADLQDLPERAGDTGNIVVDGGIVGLPLGVLPLHFLYGSGDDGERGEQFVGEVGQQLVHLPVLPVAQVLGIAADQQENRPGDQQDGQEFRPPGLIPVRQDLDREGIAHFLPVAVLGGGPEPELIGPGRKVLEGGAVSAGEVVPVPVISLQLESIVVPGLPQMGEQGEVQAELPHGGRDDEAPGEHRGLGGHSSLHPGGQGRIGDAVYGEIGDGETEGLFRDLLCRSAVGEKAVAAAEEELFAEAEGRIREEENVPQAVLRGIPPHRRLSRPGCGT